MTAGPDGALCGTTPTGQVATTHAPRYGTDDDLPNDLPPPSPPHDVAVDDPPPF